MYSPIQYVNIINQNQTLMCTVRLQALLFCLNPPNGISNANLKSNGDKASPCFKPLLKETCQTNVCLRGLCHRFHLKTLLHGPYMLFKWQQHRVFYSCWLITRGFQIASVFRTV